jgi:hypothetical protein
VKGTVERWRILTLALAVLAATVRGAAFAQLRDDVRPNYGVCEREAKKLVGREAVRIGGEIPALKKIRNVAPAYPKFPDGTTGRGMWIGEALIDPKGKVSKVWAIREAEIAPPLPSFNIAITDAIYRWEFEPLQINRIAVPVCMTVTMNIDWQ